MLNLGLGIMSKDDTAKKKKQRKTYTITKPRESWTDEEHQRFLDALKLYDRDWKKIETYIRTKSVIQIRSHAQKYFIKMQKVGRVDLIPPPRPKRKADKPYPKSRAGQVKGKKKRKTAKKGKDESPEEEKSQSRSGDGKSGKVSSRAASSSSVSSISSGVANNPTALSAPAVTPALNWQLVEQQQHQQLEREQLHQAQYYLQQAMFAQAEVFQTQLEASGSNKQGHEFSKVYTFLGELFDPSTTGHMEKLQELSSVDRQIVQVLMHNLACNLSKHARQDPSWPVSVHNRVMALDQQISSFNSIQNGGATTSSGGGNLGNGRDRAVSSTSSVNSLSGFPGLLPESMPSSIDIPIGTHGSDNGLRVNVDAQSLSMNGASSIDILPSPTALHLHELPSPSGSDLFKPSPFGDFSSTRSVLPNPPASARSKNAADVLSTMRQSPR